MPDKHVPRTDGPHMAGNFPNLENLNVVLLLHITIIVISAPGLLNIFHMLSLNAQNTSTSLILLSSH